MIMAVLIGLHNIPEGMAVSVPLINGGMATRAGDRCSRPHAACPRVLGAWLGFWLGDIGPLGLHAVARVRLGRHALRGVRRDHARVACLIYRSKLPRLRRHGWPSPRHVHDLLLESWANLADARMIEEFSVGKPNLPGLRIMRGHRRPRPSSSSSQSAGKMILRVSRRHSHLRTAMRASAKKRSVNELVEKCTRS